MAILEYNEIKEKKIIIYSDEPCLILEAHVARTQQRKPQNQVKLKSLLSGRTFNATFHASDKAHEADISKKDIKFLYTNKGEYWFSDPKDPKNRFTITENVIGDSIKFLKENELVSALLWENDSVDTSTDSVQDKIINIELPVKMEFKIKEAPPSIKGNSANSGNKPVVLENGTTINVPLFIEAGETIRVNTQTSEYVERAN